MNKHNRLLDALDGMYGFRDKKKSSFREIARTYDERSNEYVFHVEYRVRRGEDVVKTKRSKKNRLFQTIMNHQPIQRRK